MRKTKKKKTFEMYQKIQSLVDMYYYSIKSISRRLIETKNKTLSKIFEDKEVYSNPWRTYAINFHKHKIRFPWSYEIAMDYAKNKSEKLLSDKKERDRWLDMYSDFWNYFWRDAPVFPGCFVEYEDDKFSVPVKCTACNVIEKHVKDNAEDELIKKYFGHLEDSVILLNEGGSVGSGKAEKERVTFTLKDELFFEMYWSCQASIHVYKYFAGKPKVRSDRKILKIMNRNIDKMFPRITKHRDYSESKYVVIRKLYERVYQDIFLTMTRNLRLLNISNIDYIEAVNNKIEEELKGVDDMDLRIEKRAAIIDEFVPITRFSECHHCKIFALNSFCTSCTMYLCVQHREKVIKPSKFKKSGKFRTKAPKTQLKEIDSCWDDHVLKCDQCKAQYCKFESHEKGLVTWFKCAGRVFCKKSCAKRFQNQNWDYRNERIYSMDPKKRPRTDEEDDKRKKKKLKKMGLISSRLQKMIKSFIHSEIEAMRIRKKLNYIF